MLKPHYNHEFSAPTFFIARIQAYLLTVEVQFILQATSENAFEMLVKPVRRLVEQKGFSKPTEPQEKTIPKILEGKNVLLISPTATGKTEAAFLPILKHASAVAQNPRHKSALHYAASSFKPGFA